MKKASAASTPASSAAFTTRRTRSRSPVTSKPSRRRFVHGVQFMLHSSKNTRPSFNLKLLHNYHARPPETPLYPRATREKLFDHPTVGEEVLRDYGRGD